MRRLLDLLLALIILSTLSIPMILIYICVRLTSEGGALFGQQRVGRRGRLFRILKFRSMTGNEGPGLTRAGDQRVTPLGRYLRKLKLDELPQMINVLRGDMSVVGPRPKLPRYATIPNMPYRPGLTSPATIAFWREEEMLRNVDAAKLDQFYADHIDPVKTQLDVCYMCTATAGSDLKMIVSTIVELLIPGHDSPSLPDRVKPESDPALS